MKLKTNASSTTTGDFLNLSQAAVYLGLSEPSVRKCVKEGKIPFRKVGARYLFSRAALRRWADGETTNANKTGPGDDV